MLDGERVHCPASPALQLVLLFHGVGATAADLVPLGGVVARALPQAMVVGVNAPLTSSLGRGREWFSVLGVTEDNRPERVAQAMEAFAQTVDHWQAEAGVAPARTTLIGFSQGAIMALESMRLCDGLSGRVVAIAGRFAAMPQRKPGIQTVHVIHGEQDPVINVAHGLEATRALQHWDVPVTLDVFPGLGHGIDHRVATAVTSRLLAQAA
jgi:phospholipase/carboxylesterase